MTQAGRAVSKTLLAALRLISFGSGIAVALKILRRMLALISGGP